MILKKMFIELSQMLKEIREENEFNEIGLNNFQLKLTQIPEEFLQPSNISIRQDLQEFIKKISVISSSKPIQTKKDKFQQLAITVASGNGQGNNGVNNRVIRWCEGDKEGEIVVGGNGKGNQLNIPTGLSFDNEENLYVVDGNNHRIQKYGKI
ncbi:unnamed protein product [Adineta steineri]|uniref:NHL repeat containing protein n=1 Tax=Adineta steineri TaxID=433720 RepID=A0A814H4T4_9BILA|nr:unnamed protein product [Adineta steineri]CAF3730267.1 unnamed protein product [Adineta steineri]